MNTELFPLVFIALFVGHSVGDHWVQTGHQSAHKHLPGWEGRLSCLRHVATLTFTKLVLLIPAIILAEWPSLFWLCAGVILDASSHYWADRRFTLERLSNLAGRGRFYHFGTDTIHRDSPDGSHIGTGKYVLDQSFHYLFLFVSSVVISM